MADDENKVEQAAQGAKEKAEEVVEAAKDKAEEVVEAVEDKAEAAAEAVQEKAEDVASAVQGKAEEAASAVQGKVSGMADAAKDAAADGKAAKKGKKKWPIVVGVVAVVLVAAGAGFWMWHEQPSFCAAICHTPMDAYYATYEEGSQDKYGNEMDDTSKLGMMAYLHKTVAGTTCMGCHVPTLSEQITEGLNWVTGNYEVAGTNALGQTILETRDLEELTAARGAENEDEFCLNESCHTNDDGSVMTRDDLEALTEDLSDTRNPHKAQHGEYSCTQCHQAHGQSVNYCSQCHSDAPIPDGWLTVSEAKSLQTLE